MTQTLAASARASADEVRITRWVAIVAGLLGFVLSILTRCCRWCRPPRRSTGRRTVS